MTTFLATTVLILPLVVALQTVVIRRERAHIWDLKRDCLLATDDIRDLAGEVAELSGVIGTELDAGIRELS